MCLFFFFFKQKTAYEMRISDWSSDVCSSDPADAVAEMAEHDPADRARDEAQRIGGEGEQGADQRLELGKEQLVEDQRRGRTVEEEIVPFDRGADQARR